MITINRTVANVLLAIVMLASAAAVAEAQDAASAQTPLRVAIELEPGSGTTFEKGWEKMVAGVIRNSVKGNMPKGAVEMVEPAESADLVVKVRYLTLTLPATKPGRAPQTLFDSLTAAVDGRALKVEHSVLHPWDSSSRSMGADIAAILKLRTAVVPDAATEAAQLDVLIKGLSTRNALERVRMVARIAALGKAANAATSALVELLGDERVLRIVGPGTATTVGAEVANALVRVGSSSTLVDVFKSGRDDKARYIALSTLARINHPEKANLIMAGLDDPDGSVRTVATFLAKAVGTKAIPRLIEILGEKNVGNTRKNAHSSLVWITSQDFGLDAGTWRAWWTAKNAAGR